MQISRALRQLQCLRLMIEWLRRFTLMRRVIRAADTAARWRLPLITP